MGPAFQPSRQLLELASWRFVAELARRHPERFAVLRTHPGGGQYDCLSLIANGGPEGGHIDLNRGGSLHVHRRFDDSLGEGQWTIVEDFWGRYLAAEDPRDLVIEVERLAGLPHPKALPAGTRGSLTLRVVAACLAPAALGRIPWEWANGVHDSSGMEGTFVREDLFAAFAGTRARRLESRPDDPMGEAAYRFWFLLRAGEPVLAIETNAHAWTAPGGEEVDFMALYHRHGRRLSGVVGELLTHHLP